MNPNKVRTACWSLTFKAERWRRLSLSLCPLDGGGAQLQAPLARWAGAVSRWRHPGAVQTWRGEVVWAAAGRPAGLLPRLLCDGAEPGWFASWMCAAMLHNCGGGSAAAVDQHRLYVLSYEQWDCVWKPYSLPKSEQSWWFRYFWCLNAFWVLKCLINNY